MAGLQWPNGRFDPVIAEALARFYHPEEDEENRYWVKTALTSWPADRRDTLAGAVQRLYGMDIHLSTFLSESRI